jgi:hypothetical protein
VFSGEDLDIRSKKNTEITSSEESIRLFARKMGLIYTEKGAILLETNSEAGEFTGGVPEARVNSGIMLRTLKEQGPIVLESKEDKIVLTSKKSTSLQVLDAEAKFYLEGPSFLMNLSGGARSMKVKADSITLDADTALFVNAGRAVFDLDLFFGVDSAFVVLSASQFARFHAPPPGVDVAHTHFGGEFRYAGDAHGIYTTRIVKRNSHSPLTVEDVDGESFEVNTTPHYPPTLTKLLFDWRTEYNVETWYETTWAAKLKETGGGTNWDLLADTVAGTYPFPGPEISAVRFKYARSNPEGSQPGFAAGSFSGTSEYKIPS